MATQFYKTLEDWQTIKHQQQQKIEEKIQSYNSVVEENFDDALVNMKKLAGLGNGTTVGNSEKIIDQASRNKFIKEHNIKTGTPRWFKVMYARPELTGEDPFGE